MSVSPPPRRSTSKPIQKSGQRVVTATKDLMLLLVVNAAAAEVSVDLTVEDLNGQHRIVKTYEPSPGIDPQTLKKPSFEYDSFTYTWAYITKEEHTFLETKDVTETVSVKTSGTDLSTVLEQLASSSPTTTGNTQVSWPWITPPSPPRRRAIPLTAIRWSTVPMWAGSIRELGRPRRPVGLLSSDG